MSAVLRSRNTCALAIAAACLIGGPAAAEQLTIVTNNGRGSGTYKAIPMSTLGSTNKLGYRVLSGTFHYWTIHARYKSGSWKTVYKGRQNNIPMGVIQRKIAALRRGQPTHLNFSVNGAHERYDRVACRLAIVRPGGRAHAINIVAGTYGQNCGTRRGNKTAHLRQACQGRAHCVYTIDYKVIGDPRPGCAKSYIAEWRCPGSSAIRRLVATPEAGYRKTLSLSCQGNHGLTTPPPVGREVGVVLNNGRGGRGGGTYKAFPYSAFGAGIVGYRVLSGTFRYWTIHARYKGGSWKTVYKGPRNNIPMGVIQRKVASLRRGQPTHLNFSVNGAHEQYDRVACRLAIMRRGGRAHTPPPAQGRAIHVVAGTYGKNCGTRRGNKTAHLRRACQGRTDCLYTINYRVIGDPRPGCAKNYIAEWRCAGSSAIRRLVATPEAGYRKKLRLSCGR